MISLPTHVREDGGREGDNIRAKRRVEVRYLNSSTVSQRVLVRNKYCTAACDGMKEQRRKGAAHDGS
jgi:hypothetical protein